MTSMAMGRMTLSIPAAVRFIALLGGRFSFNGPYNTGATGTPLIDRFLPIGRDAIATVVGGVIWVYRWDDSSSAFVG
jgi:hypothetical protein